MFDYRSGGAGPPECNSTVAHVAYKVNQFKSSKTVRSREYFIL